MNNPLSPAAQSMLNKTAQAMERSVLIGFLPYQQHLIVAALRSIADTALPYNARGMANRQQLRRYILSIAAELEANAQ
jgi:hypothetical protein